MDKQYIESIRKTPAYKICGYLGILLIILIVSCLVMYLASSGNGWGQLALIVMGIIVTAAAPIIILPVYLILTITAHFTKDKFLNYKTHILADIGYVTISIMFLVGISILPFTVDFLIDFVFK